MADGHSHPHATVTYLGHACILVEIGGARILMDPWLVGPSNGNGWWHLPAAAATPESLGSVDYVMISHVHNDHFHIPSLKRLPKTATVMVPYGLDPWMANALREIGFNRVTEVEHGQTQHLPGDISVENYQHGRIDSAYWLQHGNETILNLNDCPTPDWWLREWLCDHPPPDVALSAFSYASPFPVCYDVRGENREYLLSENVARVLDQFARTMGMLQPRFAVPFATQYGFFLPGCRWMTSNIPIPQAALDTLSSRHPNVGSALLNPGDRLSVRDGKTVTGRSFDWNARERELDSEIEMRADEINKVIAEEEQPPPDCFERFRFYFEGIISKNWLLRRRLPNRIAFVTEPEDEWWTLDCTRRRDFASRSKVADVSLQIRLPRALLSAALEGEIHWETLYLSNRLHITVDKDDLDSEWQFWRMLFNFPEGILRDRLRLFSTRGRRVLRRRYPELLRLVRERIARSSNREPYVDANSDSTSERSV